jgi:predicted DNA-binding protein YlxM (UPF0122 family)
MNRSQGKYFSKDELNRIVMLLRDSDMTLPEIADRMRCSRSAVAAINRKFQVRLYGGKRSQWTLSGDRQPMRTEVLDSSSEILQETVAAD